MQIKTIKEVEKQLNISLETLLNGDEWSRYSATFRLPEDAGALTAISRSISLNVNASLGSLLIIQEMGIWPSFENLYLVETFRRALGEMRSIREAPAHIFASDDHSNCWTMISLCFFNYWDFMLLSGDRQIMLRGSHDECLDICALQSEDLHRLRIQMQQLELKEVHPGGAHDRLTEEALISLDDMRELARKQPADDSARERFALALHDMIIQFQGVQGNRFLEELRSIAITNPEDAAVQQHFARALYSALYYAGLNNNLELVDSLLNDLRQLVWKDQEDAVIREVFAMSLFAVHEYCKTASDLTRSDLTLQELQQLGRGYPQDSEVQRWLSSAGSIH